MRLDLPPIQYQSFLFRPLNIEGLFKLAGEEENSYDLWRKQAVPIQIQFLDTPTNFYRRNGIELTQAPRMVSGPNSFPEINVYIGDNLWGTQAKRLVGTRVLAGSPRIFYETHENADSLHDDMTITTSVHRSEHVLNTNSKADIGLVTEHFPDADLTCLELFSTTSGMNFAAEDWSPEVERKFVCENYIKLEWFIQQAIDSGFIAPLPETPHTMLVAAQQNRLQS